MEGSLCRPDLAEPQPLLAFLKGDLLHADRRHRQRVPRRLRPHPPCPAEEGAGVHGEVPRQPEVGRRSTTRRSTRVKDDKVRTVRIDQKYRAVVLHPDKGDVYVLVWVDNHDEAMDWAKKRTFEVNPVTGALAGLQRQRGRAGRLRSSRPQHGRRSSGLLASSTTTCCSPSAVPEVLLPAVRAVKTPDELLALIKHLPAEAAEALIWLAEGMPPEEVRAAVAVAPTKEKVDTADLADGPRTSRLAASVRDHPVRQDLTAILDAPAGEVAGVPASQPGEAGVQDVQWAGPGPGRGRHRQDRRRHAPGEILGQHVCIRRRPTASSSRPTRRTWPRTSRRCLRHLCPECMDRIEVVHLHAWAVRFMKDQGRRFDIAYGEDLDRLLGAGVPGSRRSRVRPGLLAAGMGAGGPGQRHRDARPSTCKSPGRGEAGR